MSNIKSRIKRAESVVDDLGGDDQTRIEAYMSYYRGDKGKALSMLPPYKGSLEKRAALWVNALSRIKNEAKEKADL